ncbi:V-type ATP synthase subunit E [Halocatena halophila]|uniref:V-type ATP synthase subunit E n=1 Tax=Halocatena halophila TaxID=2814576 RepID=UPI002ED0D3CD
MSLDTVVEDIRDEARARADTIRKEAEQEADEIIADANEEADRIVEEREREVERTIEQEREQRLSSAKLEAKQERLGVRRDVLESVRESARERLATREEGREELTRALLKDGAAEFEDDELRVYGRGDDQELIESIIESEFPEFEFAGERDCLGGVILESDESRVRVNNTFDSVFEDVWDDNLREVSEQLFESDQ